MKISYNLTNSDVIEARRKHGGVALLIIGILLTIVGSYSLIQNSIQFPTSAAVIAMGLVLVFLPVLQVWYLFKQNSKLGGPFDAIISHDGIDVSSPTASTRYAWNGYIRVEETKNLFLVYRTQQVFIIFPKRAFSEGEINDFRQLLDQQLGVVSNLKRKKISSQTWAILGVAVIAAILLVRAILNILQSAPSQ